jgi:nitroreductase
MWEETMTSILLKRQSKRAYLDKPVPQDALDRIVEKTRWAPSRSNSQPWRFVIVKEPEALARFHEGLTRGNAWAKKAPVLIAVVVGEDDAATRRDDPAVQYDLFGCGLAVENLLLAAVEEGLMGHPMAGFKTDIVREALGIPDDHHIICLISLGYQGRIEDLDERTRAKDEAPRTRKDVSEMFFFDRWPAQ